MGDHYHAGHNDMGYLPEAEVACFESAEEALSYLASELDRAADEAAMGDESGGDEHPWPDFSFAAAFIESVAARRSAEWQDALAAAQSGGFSLAIDDGRVLPHVWWVEDVSEPSRDACEWRALHNQAMRDPRGWEVPLVMLRKAISEYVHQAEQEFGADQSFGSWRDYVLGEEVGALLDAFVGLLNGPTGRLDCGALDTWARTTAERIGYDMDIRSMK